jgi:hypothetical protein
MDKDKCFMGKEIATILFCGWDRANNGLLLVFYTIEEGVR